MDVKPDISLRANIEKLIIRFYFYWSGKDELGASYPCYCRFPGNYFAG